MFFLRSSLLSFGIGLLSVVSTANAQEDLSTKVLKLFESSCQECHHPDTEDDLPYLHAKIDLASLFSDQDGDLDKIPVVPGEPEKSDLIHRVSLEESSSKRMPKSKGEKGGERYRDPLSDDEQKLLRNWILGLKKKPAEKPPAEKKVPVGNLPVDIPLDDQVRWIFNEHCVECHSPDGRQNNSPELSQTTNLAYLLRRDPNGELPAQGIVERVTRDPGKSGRMPKSTGKPGAKGFRAPLTPEEQKVLQTWLTQGAKKQQRRDPIALGDVVSAISSDVRKQRDEARFMRYLHFANLYNVTDAGGTPQVDDDTLDSHRAGLSKLLNSLSANGGIHVPVAIDDERIIFRIDLRNYQWTAADWERLVGFYPHGLIGVSAQKETLIERRTGSKRAYLRADWFAFATAQPPFYHEILDRLFEVEVADDDNLLAGYEKSLGVDRVQNIRGGRAIRAGFQLSGVSEANRLIERHALGKYAGAYWISYDFVARGGGARDNLFRAPLGPPEAELTPNINRVFDHDGGEVIFNLPNGLQAYLLVDAKGKRLAEAPIEVVQDDTHPQNIIINGISCMRCHDEGMRPAIKVRALPGADPNPRELEGMTDEIRRAVEGANILTPQEQRLLRRLHPEPQVLRQAILADQKRFEEAEKKSFGSADADLEPIAGLYEEYLRMVDARRLSAELGMSFDEIVETLEEEAADAEALAVFLALLKLGQADRRDEFLSNYLKLAFALGFAVRPFEPLAYQEFGGEKFAKRIRESDAFVNAFGAGPKPVEQPKEKAKEALVIAPKALEQQALDVVDLPGEGTLSVRIHAANVRVGDKAKLEVSASEDVHIRVVHLSSDQFVTELFPGATGQDSLVPVAEGKLITWTTTDPGGPEHVIVYASRKKIPKRAKARAIAGDFLVFERKNFFSTRGIPTQIRAEAASENSARPAPVVQARVGYFLKER